MNKAIIRSCPPVDAAMERVAKLRKREAILWGKTLSEIERLMAIAEVDPLTIDMQLTCLMAMTRTTPKTAKYVDKLTDSLRVSINSRTEDRKDKLKELRLATQSTVKVCCEYDAHMRLFHSKEKKLRLLQNEHYLAAARAAIKASGWHIKDGKACPCALTDMDIIVWGKLLLCDTLEIIECIEPGFTEKLRPRQLTARRRVNLGGYGC